MASPYEFQFSDLRIWWYLLWVVIYYYIAVKLLAEFRICINVGLSSIENKYLANSCQILFITFIDKWQIANCSCEPVESTNFATLLT